jgi:dienelactone hydrolase
MTATGKCSRRGAEAQRNERQNSEEHRETHVLSAPWRLCVRLLWLLPLLASDLWAGDARLVEHGQVDFVPTAAEAKLPPAFRLQPQAFAWEARRMLTELDEFAVWDVTFPSPVNSSVELNNTVHCEYYQTKQAGRRPSVIVLHILGGDFPLSRLFCNALAQRGVSALFVKMPYYGPRRDPNSPQRMVSPDPRATVAGMSQAVLDIRRATAWLASRPENDPERLGIFGISLGGITGCLAAANEPRLTNVCLLLAGGDVGQVAWDSLEIPGQAKLLTKGTRREEFVEIIRAVDPVTYAAAARGKRILMLNASADEIIPRACTESLWKALGEPQIHWYPGGHYSVIRHLFGVLHRVPEFFATGAKE